jgi:hypothetical protein
MPNFFSVKHRTMLIELPQGTRNRFGLRTLSD